MSRQCTRDHNQLWWVDQESDTNFAMPQWREYDSALRLIGQILTAKYLQVGFRPTAEHARLYAVACGIIPSDALHAPLSAGSQLDAFVDVTEEETLCALADELAARREADTIIMELGKRAVA